MKRKISIRFTLITLLVGFMVAIQFRSVQSPEIRDTRDIWELRQAISEQRAIQSQLLAEVSSVESNIKTFENEREDSKELALRETLDSLEKEAGLTEVTGPGIVLTFEPLQEELLFGQSTPSITPELLDRLVNELNLYQAKEISIDGQRVINTTVIRDINGETKVDNHSLRSFPFSITVLARDMKTANELYNRISVASVIDDFFIDNLTVRIEEPKRGLTVPAYNQPLRIRHMEIVEEKGE